MIYKVLCLLLLAGSFRAAPVHDQPSAKAILVYDDNENAVLENLDDLEPSVSADNSAQNGFPNIPQNYEDIDDPLAADTSRNPSPKPELNQESTTTSQATPIVDKISIDALPWGEVNKKPQATQPITDIFDTIRNAAFNTIDRNKQKVKEGINSILETWKSIFQAGRKSMNFLDQFGGDDDSNDSLEFEDLELL